jgi:hypothetical protein
MIKVQVEGNEEQEIRVRDGTNLSEILDAAYLTRQIEKDTVFPLEESAQRPSDGAIFKFSKQVPSRGVPVWFTYVTYDGRRIANRLEVDRHANLETLWPQIQSRTGEQLEDVRYYGACPDVGIAILPWKAEQKYELKPGEEVTKSLAVRRPLGSIAVTDPKFRKEPWPGLITSALGRPVASITESGPDSVTGA